MTWWLWVLLGFFLLIAEMLTPGGFYMCFFGAGAITVGALHGLGWAGPDWLQWLLFSVLSVVSLLFIRRPLIDHLRRTNLGKNIDTLLGETVITTEDIPAHGVGKAELRGTTWTVQNEGDTLILRGQRGIVQRVDGLTLFVK